MIDKPDADFNMGQTMTALQISLHYNVKEESPHSRIYTFVAELHGMYGRGVKARSHAPTPENAVHNVVDYQYLRNLNFHTAEQAVQFDLHRARALEADALMDLNLDPNEFGGWIDRVTGNLNRDPKRVAGRALEELTELCLEIGLTYGEVLGHVGDAWHNQCLKVSLQEEKTVWPSQLHQHVIPSDAEAAKELADTRLTLLDLQHLIKADEALIQRLIKAKAEKLYQAHADGRLRFTGDTFYIVKDHVK